MFFYQTLNKKLMIFFLYILITVILINYFLSFHLELNQFDSKQKNSQCKWVFVEYFPSEWELSWSNNIDYLKDKVCWKLSSIEESLKLNSFMKQMIEPEGLLKYASLDPNFSLFSKQRFKLSCDGYADSNKLMEMMLEPLVGNTRDPLTMCPINYKIEKKLYPKTPVERIQSKRHLILAPMSPIRYKVSKNSDWSPWMNHEENLMTSPLKQKNKNFILFDIGSSYYGSWLNKSEISSTSWFVEKYQKNGIKFNRIIAFESYPLNSTIVWGSLPDDIVPFYTLINLGVSLEGKLNPWNILKILADPQDFVIIKIDIDTPTIENKLLDMLLEDPILLELVDEIFYEHHVDIPEMWSSWGRIKNLTLVDTYQIFTKLRESGIRMHSWP